jgi:hypothetical protein
MIQKTIAILFLVSLQALDTTELSAQVAKGFRTTISINYETGKAIYTVSNERDTAVKIDVKTWLSLFERIGFYPVLEDGETGNGSRINFVDLKVKIRNKYLGKPHHYSQRDKLWAKIKAETPLVYDNSLDSVKFAETDLPMILGKGEAVTVEVFLGASPG